MMLLVDIGNSSVKIQCWRNDQLQSSLSRRIEGQWESDLSKWLKNNLADRCFVASVRWDESHDHIIEILNRYYQPQQIKIIRPEEHSRLSSCYIDITRMGVDRWLALLGCEVEINGPAVIVDAGSAITIDLLDSAAHHLGGAILAGFHTSPERFISIMKTADFSHPDIATNDEPGCSTESCIHIDYAKGDTRDRVADVLQRWKDKAGQAPTLVLSGGDSSFVPTDGFSKIRVFTDLVFKGMKVYGQELSDGSLDIN